MVQPYIKSAHLRAKSKNCFAIVPNGQSRTGYQYPV